MESPEVPGSPTEYEDDVSYPCKGCGEILEEGKAFELANNRWHIDCFRCNTCGTLLDSDANLLLLADGSLICNQCTYSCTACGNKIEDLAILTGDQAFCAGCFRCRNCKRKIENLRYARTSQGIFCMSCHESLMARRKKRQKSARQAHNTISSPQLALDKSLPAIPQDVDDDDRNSSFSETPTELSPRPARPPPPTTRTATNTPSTRSDQLSPSLAENHPRIPRPYNNNRHSQIYHQPEVSELAATEPEPYSFVPLVLDSSPPAPLQNTSYRTDSNSDTVTPRKLERPPAPKSYSSNTSETPELDGGSYEGVGRKPVPTQPSHIAYQEKGRQGSLPIDRQDGDRKSVEKKAPTGSAEASPYPSRTSSRTAHTHTDLTTNNTPSKLTTLDSNSLGSKERWDSFKLQEVPNERKRTATGGPTATSSDEIPSFSPTRSATGSTQSAQTEAAKQTMSREATKSQKQEQSTTELTIGDIPEPHISIQRKEVPPRVPVPSATDSKLDKASSARTGQSQKISNLSGHKSSRSDDLTISIQDTTPMLPLPIRTPGADFSMDEDIARMLGQEPVSSPSLLRKTSNAVRHGRSYSDLAVALENKEDNSVLKNELKRANMRVAELEMKLSNLGASPTLDPGKIDEQRLVIANLESQREVRVRELEILAAGKEGRDFETFRKDAIRNLAKELEDLRNSYEAQIQALSMQRALLLEETAKLSQIRDQTIQDTEQLNMKNAQLMDLNNEITRQIQGRFQSHKGTIPAPNGLNILNKDGTEFDYNRPHTGTTSTSATITNNSMHEHGDDDDVIIAQPTIVNVGRKGGYIKKSWKKGGAAIIKGAGKGFNKVFMNDSQGHGQQTFQGNQYDMSSNLASLSESGPYLPRSATAPDPHGGLDKIFGGKKFGNKQKTSNTNNVNGGNIQTVNSLGPLETKNEATVPLFGSELEARAAYEGKSIPYVVSRCIQEVEARGMEFEGIYRKSGGASSMRQIQEAFERGEELDIGDNVDICGVTSVLKQYFRKLPTPIITPAIYDDFLKSSRLPVEERVQEVKNIMSQLSIVHQDVLGYVIFHLRKVSEKESKNLMTTRNLAVVFAPTLMWHEDKDREMHDMHEKNNAIQFLIEHGESIFFN